MVELANYPFLVLYGSIFHMRERESTTIEGEFRTRLSQILQKFGSVASLARALGVSDNAIYKWMAGGGEPSVANLVALARAGGVSVEWLATGRDPRGAAGAAKSNLRDDYVFVPRHQARLRAGRGTAHIRSEQVVDYIAFKAGWIRRELKVDPRNLLLVEAIGDSMTPTIKDSDLMLVDLGEPRFRQDGIYVIRLGDDLVVRRIQRAPNRKFMIRSDNPAYESIVVSSEDAGIVGRVIWAAGRI